MNTLTAIVVSLDTNPEFFTLDGLYDDYMDGNYQHEEQEAIVSEISRKLDCKVDARCISHEDLAEYEESARRAGFYAGFNAAQTAMQELNTAPCEDAVEGEILRIFRSLTGRERGKALGYMQGLAAIH